MYISINILILLTILNCAWAQLRASDQNGCQYDSTGKLIAPARKLNFEGQDNPAVSIYCLDGYYLYTSGLSDVTIQKNVTNPEQPIVVQAFIGDKRGSGVIRKTTKIDHVKWDVVNPTRQLEARAENRLDTGRWIILQPPKNINTGRIRGERRGEIIYISTRGSNGTPLF